MVTTCPACKEDALSKRELEPNLQASQCSKCSGVWIGALQYEHWLEVHGESLPEKPAEAGISLVSGEKPAPRSCPECSYMLMKYKIGHQLGFSLNRCGHCGGIWFDQNEWDILKSRNLHDHVHQVFSQEWQSAVSAEEHKEAMENIWRSQFGDDDLNEIKRIKNWLETHPKSAELFAYLLAGREFGKKSSREAAAI